MTRALRLAAAACSLAALVLAALIASPAFAQASDIAPKIDAADTAWMLGATGLVLMMTIPGLALFYAGMVRKKNVLATMAQSMAATFLVSILWAMFGYSLAFTGDGAYIGSLERIFLNGMGLDAISPLAKTIPESLFMIYQMTFAIITVALVAGSVADRLRFSAFLLFCVFWLLLVYVPIAHWVWGGGFLGSAGVMVPNPATAPEIMPSTDGLRWVVHSIAPQVSAPAQAARWVETIAMAAREFAPSADPPLKPNQPTHNRPVPMTANVRSCGDKFSLP